MVRGPAALLGGALLLLAAGALPGAGRLVPAVTGALAVAACALGVLGARDERTGLAVLAAGAALLAATLSFVGVGPAATPVEAVAAAAAGLLFAHAFTAPAVFVAVPLLVGGIAAAAALGTGAAPPDPDPVNVLTLALPRWGGGEPVAELATVDAAFLAAFAAWAVREHLRPRLTLGLLALAPAAAVAATVAAERTVPALPLIAAAFLAPAAGPLRRMIREP